MVVDWHRGDIWVWEEGRSGLVCFEQCSGSEELVNLFVVYRGDFTGEAALYALLSCLSLKALAFSSEAWLASKAC